MRLSKCDLWPRRKAREEKLPRKTSKGRMFQGESGEEQPTAVKPERDFCQSSFGEVWGWEWRETCTELDFGRLQRDGIEPANSTCL